MKVNAMSADIKNQWGFILSERTSGGADFIENVLEPVFFKTRDGNLSFPDLFILNTKFERMR